MKISLLLLSLVFVIYGCKIKVENSPNSNTSVITDSTSMELLADGDTAYTDTLKICLDIARGMREKLIADLERMTPQEASDLYMSPKSYSFDRTPYFRQLALFVDNIVQCSSGVFFDRQLTKEDEEILELLKKEGLVSEYIGEGDSVLRLDSHHYYHIFKAYVTVDTRQFIKLWSDMDNVYESDAGLIVPLDSILDRSIRWEKFVLEYPQSKYWTKAMAEYALYMNILLFCSSDNTPVFDRTTEIIDSEVLNILHGFVGRFPDSETDKIIRYYLDKLQSNDNKYSKDLEDNVMDYGLLHKWNKEYNKYN